MSDIRIGVTERGDAGIDFSWVEKLQEVSGVILITKKISQQFIDEVLYEHRHGAKIIVHCTCTGWGGTEVEPNVYPPQIQLDNFYYRLILAGFPREQCVLRIDPIIPNDQGLEKARSVLQYAHTIGLLPYIRVRVSIVDEYKHVKERFRHAGLTPVYGDKFYPSNEIMQRVKAMLSEFNNVTYELCAEKYFPDSLQFIHTGCVSYKDLKIFGLPITQMSTNPQQRTGCLCLDCKTELLTSKNPCPHECLYCYWKRQGE